ncbi:MAG TPA: ATP-binding protein [Thermodesulfovibrionales bacterium]|nr:ATP-binding protein [Thermodesulfovibrionales bacterium]
MQEVLLNRLKALILFRVFFVTLLLGTFLLFDIGPYKFPQPRSIIYLLISFYLLSTIYGFLLYRIKNLVVFAYLQLSIDALAEVFLTFLTGGIQSWFSSIMLLTVMASAIVMDKRAGYVIATTCSLLYGLMIDLQFYGFIAITYDPTLQEKDFLYNIFTHIVALYLTAFLMGHLSSRLERTAQSLEEKDSSLKDLTLFNRELIENLPSGLLTTDGSQKILLFNRAAEHITGMNKTEALQKHITDVFPFLPTPLEIGRVDGVIRYHGEMKTVGLTLSDTIDSEGRKKGYICVFQDITQLKNLEAELKHRETLAAIGELSANMAHEIRNPLASLKSSIEMLKEGALTKDHGDKLMNIAISEMDRLNKIITDFLTYSRPRPPEFSWFDLGIMLDETIELLSRTSPDPDLIRITKDFPDYTEIYADHGKLRQVFLNLGVNAIDAMPGGGELTIRTRRKEDSVTILFEDTGVGIRPENLREVFYPFFTTKDSGTGLGLSIAYRIVEEHNGMMNLTSKPGHGTVFEVTIPVVCSHVMHQGLKGEKKLEPSGHGNL